MSAPVRAPLLIRSLGRPLAIAVAFATGLGLAPVVDAHGAPASARWVLALALALLAVRRPSCLLAAIVALGVARGADLREAPPPHVDDRELDRVTGVVTGPVVRTATGHGALLVGDDAVWLWSSEPVAPGEHLAVRGYLRTARGPRGPALPDAAAQLRARGARHELTATAIERLGEDRGLAATAWRWAGEVQATGVARIDDAGGDPLGRAALRGIALGDRAAIPPELDARWRAVGIFHVLSVSGLHLALVALLCYRWLRRLLAASPWGGRIHPARWAGPPTLAIALAYTLVTGGQVATIRALVVVALLVLGAALDRPLRLVDALGVTALAMLAWRPADLLDAGFQLSFVAALVLALTPQPGAGFARRWIVHPMWLSVRMAIASAPLTAYHFQEVALGGVAGNLLFTPVIELVALPLALGGLVVDWDLPVRAASELVGLVDRAAAPLAELLPIGKVALASGGLVVVLLVLSLVVLVRRERRAADAVLWGVLCVAWALGRDPPPEGTLRVTFVDVGQGDAAIVELPGDEVWLIDAGGHAMARDARAAAAPGRALSRVLAAYGHDHVDVAVISHPHPDHYVGLYALDVPIGELWFAPGGDAGAFTELAASLAARGTRLVHPPLGLARRTGDVELVTLAPRYEAAAGAPVTLAVDPVRSVNDNSLVVAIRYRERTLLFTGDVEREGEDALVAAGLGPVDVVKVAHHGSRTSSSSPFVAATRPALAVISCGRANSFGFPADEVLARWRAVGAELARTDRDGTVTVTVDADGALAVQRFVPAVPP